MVMAMEKITRHLLLGGRALNLWTYPEATPAGQGEGPALDHTEILLRLRIVPLAATTAAKVYAAAGHHVVRDPRSTSRGRPPTPPPQEEGHTQAHEGLAKTGFTTVLC